MLVLLLALACNNPASDVDDTDDTQPADTDTGGDTDTGPDEPIVKLDPDVVQAIEAVALADLEAAEATGVQIAVWFEGEIVYQGQLGSAHPDKDVAITPDTLFQVGSDTKKMTSLALLKQVERGNLAVGDSVGDALPGFDLAQTPGWSDQATLHHLLSHQGGLFDYTPWHDDPDDSVLMTEVYGPVAERLWAHTTPGKTWNYSNPNFSLAGAATEQAAGQPWADVMAADLFVPLGMTRTFARKSEVLLETDVASGNGLVGSSEDAFDPFFASGDWAYATSEPADCADNAWTRPAGLVWSTATDMANMGGWLIDGDEAVLSDDLRGLVGTKHVNLYPAYDGYGYGYGLMVYDGVNLHAGYHDMTVWTHGGNTLAFTSTTWMLPEQRLSVSILSNGYGDDFTLTAVAVMENVAELPAATTAPPVPSDETDHAALVGEYVDPYVGRMIVTDLDGVLQLDMPDLEALGISVSPAMRFEGLTDVYTYRMEGQRYDITFVKDDDGVYRWARNRLFVGSRTTALDSRPVPVRRTPAELAIALAEARVSPLLFP